MSEDIDRELRDVLIAISVVSKQMADRIEKQEGEIQNGKENDKETKKATI